MRMIKLFLMLVFSFAILALPACGKGGGGNGKAPPVDIGGGGTGGGGGGADTVPPSVPQNLTATAISSSRIDLVWDASTDDVGVVGYRMYRSGSFLMESLADTSVSDTGLEQSTQYCYAVSAYDAAGNESAVSQEACGTTLDVVPPPPPPPIKWQLDSGYKIFHIAVADDGSVAVAGYMGPDGWDPFVAKFNADGSVAWTKPLPSTAGEDNAAGVASYNGRIYVSYFQDIFGRDTGYKEFVSVYSADGEKDPLFPVEVPACGTDGWGAGLAVDTDGIYPVSLACLSRVNFDGSIAWTVDNNTLDLYGPSGSGGISGITLDPLGSGNIYIGGSTAGKTGGTNYGRHDFWVAEYTPNGSQVWVRQWGTPDFDIAESLCATSSQIFLGGKHMDGNLGELPPQIVSYTLDGSFLWSKEYSQYDVFFAMACDSSSAYAVAGADLLKLDSNGVIIWHTAAETGAPASDGIALDKNAGIVYAVFYAYVTNGNKLLRFDATTGAKLN
ncbi:MAG TPA: hypothetical protein ENG99_01255 [bacterium]|nr:hypothetical protein [bacterium]